MQDIAKYKIFECIAGSHCYNLNHDKSDIDIRGVYMYPSSIHLSLNPLSDFDSDESHDIQFYELRKFLKLLSGNNPNIIELLYLNDEFIKFFTSEMSLLFKHRDSFISKQAKNTFSNYAIGQIAKCKGNNKWINNPQPKEAPKKRDFCWIIPLVTQEMDYLKNRCYPPDNDRFPMRPIPLKEYSPYWYENNLRDHVVSKLEHSENIYRLYHRNSGKGVFRGKDENLVVESISKEEEYISLQALLIFNKQAYEMAKRDRTNYWKWMEERNAERYILQERGEISYDVKNISHCVRLIYSSQNIFKHGRPLVFLSGIQRDFILDIKNGKFSFDYIMKYVEDELLILEELYNKSTLPLTCDLNHINAVYMEMLEMFQKRTGMK